MKELTIEFEEQLKKFIEENCGYYFDINVRKTPYGVEIFDNDSDSDISTNRMLNLISCIESEINDASSPYCEYDELRSTLDDIEECVGSLRNIVVNL